MYWNPHGLLSLQPVFFRESPESHLFRLLLREWASFFFNMHFLVFSVGVLARNIVNALPQAIDDLFQDFSTGSSTIGDGDLSKQRQF
jgi:hypothetical protein